MSDRGIGGDLGSAVLAMTAASAEPADPGTIARWLGLPGEVPHVPGMLTRGDGPPESTGHGRSSQAMRRLLDRRLAAAVAAAHGRIADHYLALWGGLADGLPSLAARPELGDADGGYGLRHLVGHLLKAGRSAEAHRLLACERPAGQGRPGEVNVWFDARHRAGQLGGYLRDLEAARRAARDAGLLGLGLGLGLEMRYTLMRVCAERSESRPYGPGRDLLLEAGLWDHVRALNDARREAQGHKGRALLGVLPYVPAGERQDVLHEAVIDAMTRPRAYPSVDEDLLADVAAHLSPEGARRAVAFAAGLEDGGSTVRALITLAPHLPSGAMRDALEAARSLPEEHDRAGALAGLAPFMTEGQAGETLPVALAMAAPFSRGALLIALVPRLPRGGRDAVLDRIGRIRREDLGRRWTKGVALLPAGRRRAALAEAARQVTPEEYVELLAELFPLLPPGDRDEVGADAYAVARTIADEEVRARALVRIAGLEPPLAVLAGLVSAARALADEEDRAGLLIEAAVRLPPEERTGPLEEAAGLARAAGNATLLIAAGAALPHGHPARHPALAEGLEIKLQDVAYENHFAYSVLDELCPVLPDDLMAVVVNEIRALGRPGYLGRFLAGRAGHLSGAALDAGLAAARSFRAPDRRARALTALADRLPPPQRQAVLEEALAAAREAGKGLDGIAGKLPPDRRRALLAEELTYRRAGFEDSEEEALAGLDGGLVPFAFCRVPVGETWGMGDAVHAVLLRAQRAWRRGGARADVVRLLRTALDRYRFVDAPGSPALAAAARDLAGPEAEREYRAAVRDIYRWF
ncbi:hypothetical protein GCM10023085_81270 [Actinomadura viridis]